MIRVLHLFGRPKRDLDYEARQCLRVIGERLGPTFEHDVHVSGASPGAGRGRAAPNASRFGRRPHLGPPRVHGGDAGRGEHAWCVLRRRADERW
jgi:hypothetical protein